MSSAEGDEFLLVVVGSSSGENEEPDTVVHHQILDLVDDILGVTHPIVTPELPLRAE